MEIDEIKHQIQEFFKRGTSYPNPPLVKASIVLVQKKDMTWWLCIDYRELNKIIVRNRYPIHRIDDLLDQLKGEKFFRQY
jgi:hypothetical protein